MDFNFAKFKAGIAHLLSLGWITIFWALQPQCRYYQERIIGWDIRLISINLDSCDIAESTGLDLWFQTGT